MLKYGLTAAAIVAVTIPVVLIFALGGGSGLPDPPECPAPTPIPYPTPLAGFETGQAPLAAYHRAVVEGVQHLTDLRDSFRKQYPTDTFFRENTFRSDYATYADDSTCTAQQLLQTQLPNVPATQGAQIDTSRLTNALNAFILSMQSGRDAVASRNVTKYHDWYNDINNKVQAIRDAVANPSGR
jgi:hypothetical protein